MARTADSAEVKAAKALSTKIVAKLVKDGHLDDASSKEAKASVVAVLSKANAPVTA